MPAQDNPAVMVARFLKANNYEQSYEAFVTESGLPPDVGTCSKGDLTLETLLEEKRAFDLSVKFEKLGSEDESARGWREPAPSVANHITTSASSTNILTVSADTIFDTSGEEYQGLFITTADRRLHILDAATHVLKRSLAGLQDSPILSTAIFRQRFLLTSAMSGQLLASDLRGHTLDRRRDHSKYVVKVAVHDDPAQPLIATAGWDCKINLYRPVINTSGITFGEPFATITLQTKPESMLFTVHPEAKQPLLLVSRTDSSFLYYYTVDNEPRLLGQQNLAPHSNAWVAFTPSAVAVCPTDPGVVAVGTGSVPHMKLLIVRLLVPPYEAPSRPSALSRLRSSLLDDEPTATETQASQARAALAIADKEDAAIRIHCTTMSPQTPYSTPAVAWRPDGTGVWVNGDDGLVRGIDAVTGKVSGTLQEGGHEVGTKVRCLWAGEVGGHEVCVSGGFDHRVVFWKTK